MTRVYDPHVRCARREMPPTFGDWVNAFITTGLAVIAGWLLGIVQASTWIRH